MRKWERDKDTINALYKKYKTGDLQLQPFFQRNLVWTENAKSLFIESILLDLPIGEIYLQEHENGSLSVIDGQQRLSTIFHFIDKKFILNDLEKLSDLNGLDSSFDKIGNLLDFEMYFVKIKSFVSEEEIIDTYSRINTNTVNLNQQELRRATYHNSDFLKLSEDLAQLEFFQYGKFFSERKRQRMNDVEFISELLACQLMGIQDKKNTLEDFYSTYNLLNNYDANQQDFIFILNEIMSIFNFPKYFIRERPKYDGENPAKNLSFTRYKQQADFYSLFHLFNILRSENITLTTLQQENFLKLLLAYDYLIEPEADIELLSKYAIRCVSQGNTKNSRDFRYQFFRYSLDYIITSEENELISELKNDYKEVFNFNFEPLSLDLDTYYSHIGSFYEELEEDD